ncbi:hypothetical protein ACFOD4_06935 [Pseudoroseomonas globiformis]|uniref:DUF222 domain-containing protein n=1 Tax=Teichococcus globiformis TaxID=2307229 RepID=A0ABV7G191_9PROT
MTLSADPLEAAIRGAADFFETSYQGDPAWAARAVAQLEYLAVEIPAGRSSRDLGAMVGPALLSARHVLRSTLGIPQQDPPQAVIDRMEAIALNRASNPDLAQRLMALPRLPQVNSATQMTLRDWEFGPPQELIDVAEVRRS